MSLVDTGREQCTDRRRLSLGLQTQRAEVLVTGRMDYAQLTTLAAFAVAELDLVTRDK